jgi:hypothetical protein
MPEVVLYGGMPQLTMGRVERVAQRMRPEGAEQHGAGAGKAGQHGGKRTDTLSHAGVFLAFPVNGGKAVAYAGRSVAVRILA